MVGLPYDCLSNPLGAVRSTFERAAAGSLDFDPAAFDRKDWGALDVFRTFLFDDDGLSQVPFLDPKNLHLIRSNSLVRFRGMVQDMLGNEFYIGSFKDDSIWRTNKFTDVASVPISCASQTRLWERRLLYCVPVPGQNPWTLESFMPQNHVNVSNDCSLQHVEKRGRGEDDDGMDCNDIDSVGRDSLASNKKQKNGDLSCKSSQEMEIQDRHTKSSTLSSDMSCPSCLVKIYDIPENDIKLNDVIEFIGVYTFDPELAVHNEDNNDLSYDLLENVLDNLPPSKVPRLHCLIYKKLTLQDFVSRSCFTERSTHLMRAVRESLLGHLKAVLGNDGLAAEFILLHLLSRVRARFDVVVVGKLSLNLTGFTRESATIFGNKLILSIKNLLAFSQAIHLSVEYLNTGKLQPEKDNNTGRLRTGILQLAHGTHLTIDETCLDAGTLNSTGIQNARLLRQLMEWQTVAYDCEYYKLEMASDVKVMILSERKSNILPADLVLPFHPIVVNTDGHSTGEELQAWRWYLASLSCLSHSIESQMQKILEDDFVAARQEDKNLKGEDFSRWLTMGQLMSASFGHTHLSLEHWQMVKELERLRKERLK